ncbi:uncharacterized protein LOC115625465 [Scaptodrosophila lebanonensis]|uniref:Uncharacterized protein LOC115625465 n=1 Tax=Drosophila lebanonensis TaxID=7225 RepID=A0A6J2TMK3_DROLE|nr:uncharacterized protein LOC115625465 [Scaptodrosophila lebanonensis]
MSPTAHKSNRMVWSPWEEDHFMNLWMAALPGLQSGRKLTHVYKEMAEALKQFGIHVDVLKIKAKMEGNKRKFKFEHENFGSSSRWKYYSKMVKILSSLEKLSSRGFEPQDHYSDSSFTPHFDEDCATLSFDDDDISDAPDKNEDIYIKDSQMSPPPVTKRRKTCASETGKELDFKMGKRKCWSPKEEMIFLELWEKNIQELRSERVNMDVYKEMALELFSHGIEIDPGKIKAKIESTKRKFRKIRDTEGPESNWVHYEKLVKILGPLESTKQEPFPDCTSSSSSNASMSSIYFDESNAVMFEPEDENVQVKASENDLVSSTEEIIEVPPPMKSNIFVRGEELLKETHVYNDRPPRESFDIKCASQKSFGELVTNEIKMLDQDLLIETKRKIYNIICDMQVKQFERFSKPK